MVGIWFLAACASYPSSKHPLRIRDDVPAGGERFSLALLQSVGVGMTPGHRVELVNNGAVFDTVVEEISRARSSIHVNTFIWRTGQPGDRLADAILERTRQGVACRVVVDPVGSVDFEKVRPRLETGGCQVLLSRPDVGSQTFHRNHRKMVIVDGRVAITGGFCIYKSWLGNGLKEDEWRDTNVRVTGPAVRQLQIAFAQNWQESGGGLLPPEAFPQLDSDGPSLAGFVASSGHPVVTRAERMTQLLIASAKRRIWIANSYFIPTEAIAQLLMEKKREGVDVRVLAPGPVHDVPPVLAAQRQTYDVLLEAGVRIWEYQPSMMHAKTMLVDDRLVVIGSTNMDPLSLEKLDEGSLVVEDESLARNMEADYLIDLGRSKEIRWAEWKKRGVFERLWSGISVMFGRIL